MPRPPFHSFNFTLVEDRRPRASLRLTEADEGFYALSVQKGSAANPISQFTRMVPVDIVERFRDAMQEIGAFGWEESYGDVSAPGSRRWMMSIVFEEGVFSLESKGGSDVPPGFDALLDELYRLDFPRPVQTSASHGASARGPLSAGDRGAFAAARQGVDFLRIAEELRRSGLPGIDAANLSPHDIERRMRDEFRHLSPSEQNQVLDALASTGLASRAWWERFFRS